MLPSYADAVGSLHINLQPVLDGHSRINGNPVFQAFLDARFREHDGLLMQNQF
jgi:hypothetical protein